MKNKLLCLALVVCMLLTCLTVTGFSAAAADEELLSEVAASADYGLASRIEDGNILHCFNWTLNQIKEELPNIAKAGFTSVQTSPLQKHDGNSAWYWLYQPTGFTLGNEIGSLNDLKSLCSEADKYGIKVIVDVVANHLAGSKSGTWASSIESDMRNSDYFHNEGACTDNNNRYDLTHKNIGMPDLKSENTTVQNKVISYVNTLKNAGVDGIRWDAAKHISLPSESCSFWSRVTDNGLYNYGEILDRPAGNSAAAINVALMQEYVEYLGVTDEPFSGMITGAVRDKKVIKSNGNWLREGIPAEKLVLWGESHDTFSNTDGWTKNLTQNQIDRAYAVVGARAGSQALYLARPSSNNFYSIYAARKGSTHYTSKEVAAVNRFHNAMIGSAEKTGSGGGCFVIWRGGGAVIVSPAGSDIDVTVGNSGGMVPEGTYKDEVSGSTWTVTSTSISGHIGSSGIVVIYKELTPVTPTTAPTTAPATQCETIRVTEAPYIIGDADADKTITILDATAIQRHLASILALKGTALSAADADRDKSVTILDATLIQRFLAGMAEDSDVSKPAG